MSFNVQSGQFFRSIETDYGHMGLLVCVWGDQNRIEISWSEVYPSDKHKFDWTMPDIFAGDFLKYTGESLSGWGMMDFLCMILRSSGYWNDEILIWEIADHLRLIGYNYEVALFKGEEKKMMSFGRAKTWIEDGWRFR